MYNDVVTYSTNNQNKYLNRLLRAKNDLFFAIALYKLWFGLGWVDIKTRYRGSILGPLWITLSMVITIAALSAVYSRLLHEPLGQIIPFLTAGMLIWTFMTSIFIESCDTFVNSKDFIDNLALPYFIYIFRTLWRNVVIFFHNIIVLLLVIILFRVPITSQTLLLVPGFFLCVINLFFISVIISILATRFRDFPPIINSLITVAFLVSPVTWKPSMLGEHSWLIRLNPFTYFLDLLRSPFLGASLEFDSFKIMSWFAVGIFLLALLVFARYRSRIPFWL